MIRYITTSFLLILKVSMIKMRCGRRRLLRALFTISAVAVFMQISGTLFYVTMPRITISLNPYSLKSRKMHARFFATKKER